MWLARALCTLALMLGMPVALALAPDISADSVRFRSFGVTQGLSQITARALAEDAQGFIWVGTQDGLNRFDGYEFKTYFHDRSNPNSLSDNHITQLQWDPSGVLWVGTLSGGVNRFDPRNERAERFNRNATPALEVGEVYRMGIDAKKRLWLLAANQPPLLFDPPKNQFIPVASLDQGPDSRWRALLVLPQGGMLLGGSSGLWYLDDKDQARQVIAPERLGSNDVSALAQTQDGAIVVGLLGGGLMKFTLTGQLLQSYLRHPNNPTTLPDNMVRDLSITRRGELWVGTQKGLAYFDPDANQFLNWFHDGADAGSLPANRITQILEDSNGLLWFGTWTGGISVHNPQTRTLKVVRRQSSRADGLPGNPIRSMWRDRDGTFWLGILDGGGLVHYDLVSGVLEHFQNDPFDQASLPHDQVQSILRRRDGTLWVATLGGLAVLGEAGFRVYTHAKNDPSSLHSNALTSIAEDDDQRLWIASEDSGIATLCHKCERFERVLDGSNGGLKLPEKAVNTVKPGPLGRMFIGTAGGGLVDYDRHSGNMLLYQAKADDPQSISHNAITSIDPSTRGGYWIGTQGGGINYMSWDARTGQAQFKRLDKSRGLSADAVGSVIEDQHGHAWIATTVGISEYDPELDALRNLNAGDGLDRAGYFINSYAKGDDGTLYFGGLNGMVLFNPNQLRTSTRLLNTTISDFRLFNRPMATKDVDPRSPLLTSPSYVESLEFEHAQDMWTVVFSALNYTAPETTAFNYQLEGFDPGWIAGRSRIATYSKVPPGRYRLRARASADDGLNYGPELTIPMLVRPAPWLSAWSLLAYVIALSLLAYWLMRRGQLRKTERLATQQVINQSRERLQMALWGSRDELWDIELPTGAVVRENPLPQLSADAGYNLRLQSYFEKNLHPDDVERANAELKRHLRGESENFECIYRARGLEREWVWILGRGRAVVRDASGRVLRMVGTNRDISELKDTEQRLIELNEQLEQRVERRTDALQQTNKRLERTLSELTETQKRLVETEKMASLGNLVAGIAHEINTPVGIGVTAASHLREQAKRLADCLETGAISKSQLVEFAALAQESSRLVLTNLERASHLIRSFKQVAVDQSSEQKRRILLGSYLAEVLYALQPQLKRTPHTVAALEGIEVEMETFPGAIYQVVTNLINNSLLHGFTADEAGLISISWTSSESHVQLSYRDSGAGMVPEVARRVFEPFYTTRRGQGGSGLGMHICYNLITQLLRGSIELKTAPGEGVHFLISLPKVVPAPAPSSSGTAHSDLP